jgi:hypothetical protein
MTAREEDRMPRPPFDTVAFVFGSLFVLVAMLGLLGPSIARRLDLGIVFPLALVAIGIAVLTSSISSRGSGR